MKEIAAIVAELQSDKLKKGIESGGINLVFDGEEITLSVDDDLIMTEHDAGGFSVVAEEDIAVALDISLDDELIAEGFARELVNRIQNTRKEAGFEVTDRVDVGIEAPERMSIAVRGHSDWIKGEVLARSLTFDKIDGEEFLKKWKIDGEEVSISISRNKE
jgi:isoleucyl-tRNA synthetase